VSFQRSDRLTDRSTFCILNPPSRLKEQTRQKARIVVEDEELLLEMLHSSIRSLSGKVCLQTYGGAAISQITLLFDKLHPMAIRGPRGIITTFTGDYEVVTDDCLWQIIRKDEVITDSSMPSGLNSIMALEIPKLEGNMVREASLKSTNASCFEIVFSRDVVFRIMCRENKSVIRRQYAFRSPTHEFAIAGPTLIRCDLRSGSLLSCPPA
jgi:hypothetical protein